MSVIRTATRLLVALVAALATGTALMDSARAETTNEYLVYRWQELTGQCGEKNDSSCKAAMIVKDDLEKRGCVLRKGEGSGYWTCDVIGAGTTSAVPE
jgi:hypothetical protein